MKIATYLTVLSDNLELGGTVKGQLAATARTLYKL